MNMNFVSLTFLFIFLFKKKLEDFIKKREVLRSQTIGKFITLSSNMRVKYFFFFLGEKRVK